MKKRILCTIIMASLILSMTACGSTDTADTASTEEVTVSVENNDEASADNSEEAETEPTAEAETEAENEAETEAPIEVQDIYHCSFFTNGYAYLSCRDGSEYIFNAKDNTVMLKDNDEWNCTSIYPFGDYIFLPDYNISYVVDPQTGEIAFKSGDDDLYIHAWDNEAQKLVITKKEESFEGNKLYVGVMNNKLEWDYELTEVTSDALSGANPASCSYLPFGDKLLVTDFSKKLMVYSLKDKTLTDMSDDFTPRFLSTDKGKHICYDHNCIDLMCFDSDGEIKKICEPDDGANINIISNTIVINYRNNWSFYDLDLNKLGFDLSSYDIKEILDVNSEFIAFAAENPDGVVYTIIMDKNNNIIGDPIKTTYYDVVLTDDYAVLTGMKIIVNLKTGEAKEAAYSIEYVDNATGKMIVKSSDDHNFYLVDPADPDTLINPLEIAK